MNESKISVSTYHNNLAVEIKDYNSFVLGKKAAQIFGAVHRIADNGPGRAYRVCLAKRRLLWGKYNCFLGSADAYMANFAVAVMEKGVKKGYFHW